MIIEVEAELSATQQRQLQLRWKLQRLNSVLGKAPAGHYSAYEQWMNLAFDAHVLIEEKRPWRRINSDHGRVGFLALAHDALDRGDYNDFQDVCIGAAMWEAERMGSR